MEGEDRTSSPYQSGNKGKKKKHNSNDDQQGINRARWSDPLHEVFVEVCYKQVLAGERPKTHLSKKGWMEAVREFNQITKKNYNREQLKNHWEKTKDLWKVWQMLINNTGGGWNGETFEQSDEWWDDYLERFPDAKPFRERGLEHAHKLDAMFGGSVAWGPNSVRIREFSTGPVHNQDADHDVVPEIQVERQGVDFPEVDLNDDSNSDEDIVRDPDITSSGGRISRIVTPISCRQGRLSGAARLGTSLDRLVDAIEQRSRSSRSQSTPQFANSDSRSSIQDCIDMLNDMGNISRGCDLYMFACTWFLKPEHRELFVALRDPDLRFSLLEREHRRN